MEGSVAVGRILHVGCGAEPLPEWLSRFQEEVRVDIDPATKPHFVRDMLNLHDIGTYDAIYSCHCLEHLYPYQVPRALKEFMRVLNPGGAAIIVVPDLEDVRRDTKPLVNSDLGLICGLDMFYGAHTELEACPYMAHHCGFIESTLRDVLNEAGFVNVKTLRLMNYNLCATAEKPVE